MTLSQREGPTKFLRDKAKEAIKLALESRWEEAVHVNQAILHLTPQDTEAHNRLGKALMELGLYEEAKDAFRQALVLKPSNAIARKNLDRLERMQVTAPKVKREEKLSAAIFVEESGKTCVAHLQNLAPREVLATVSAGDVASLTTQGNIVWVASSLGEQLGHLEPRLGLRLSRLMQRGNEYVAAVTSANERDVVIIIRETYQHPNQVGIVSFPGKVTQGYPSFIEEVPIPYDRVEEEFIAGSDDLDEESTETRGSDVYRGSALVPDEEEEF